MFNKGISSKVFFIIMTFLIFSAPSVTPFFGLQPHAHAKAARLSPESGEILYKTGRAMAELSKIVKPSIVNIATIKTEKYPDQSLSPLFNDPFFRRFFGDRFRPPEQEKERQSISLGSGVIVSTSGYILTNNHVIANADKIKVRLPDKREFTGEVIGSDPKTDLAIIKIDAQELSPLELGNSDELEVGEIVLAIGNPFGLSQTITMGIVSAVGRANVGIADYEDFIQTDAAINPGNSGGALVNVRGELIGINTAIFSTTGGYQGIGFAIPSNMVKSVADSLIKEGRVIRGWLGVSIQSITPELATQFGIEENRGVLVADVFDDGPAASGGLMRGDVITEFAGEEVNEPYLLRNIVAATKPGDKIELTAIRDGEIEYMQITIGELPSESQKIQTRVKNVLIGINVRDLTPDIYSQLSLPPKIRGVIVADIETGSPAESKLKPGDIILEINRKAISNVEDYESIASKIKPERDVLLLVFRKGSTIFLSISSGKE